MTRDELLAALWELAGEGDYERGHARADSLLLEFINDHDVTEAYDKIGKWYA